MRFPERFSRLTRAQPKVWWVHNVIPRLKHTQPMSNRVFLPLHCSSMPIPTTTPCWRSRPIAFVSVKGGPGRLIIGCKPNEKKAYRARKTTYTRLDLHCAGKGREGVKITPILALAISAARRCASAAPANVSWIVPPVAYSTSDLSLINVAIMSALCTWTTNGNEPYSNVNNP